MLTNEEGTHAVHLARQTIEHHFRHNINPLSERSMPAVFKEKRGVFVTLHSHPQQTLRGCIGFPLPTLPLYEAIRNAATSAAFQDPRFPPVTEPEIENLQIEITILTIPQPIKVTQPTEYPNKIHIGRDGLIVEQGIYKGLLLPQVPVEQNWDVAEFLSHTCMKAGLPPDAWLDDTTRILSFSGQIFTETKPNGTILEKHIDGSDN